MNQIEALKQEALNKLETLQKVGSDLEALKAKLADVSVADLIASYLKTEVTKIDNYAKKNGVAFKVDTNELVGLVKLPVVKEPVAVPYQILPFIPRIGTTVEDQNWETWRLLEGGTWSNDWHESWDSSSANC